MLERSQLLMKRGELRSNVKRSITNVIQLTGRRYRSKDTTKKKKKYKFKLKEKKERKNKI